MIQNIQILRFAAAMLVVLHHATPPVVREIVYPVIPGIHQVAKLGFAGVDVFFVISGAIMAETTRSLQTGWHTAVWFAARRFARVYAGWWPVFAILLLTSVFTGVGSDREIHLLKSFFLVPQPLNFYLLPIVWTLVYELYFYVLISVLLLFGRSVQVRGLFVVGLVIASVTVVLAQQGFYTPERFGAMPFWLEFAISPFVLEFVAGFLLCEYLRQHPVQPWKLWLAVSGVFLLAAYWYQTSGLLHDSGMAGFFHYPERVLLFGIPACGILAVAMTVPEAKATVWRLMARLGDASYALYLTHMLSLAAIYMLMRKVPGLMGLGGHVVSYLIALAACVIYSWLHYRWLELPLHRASNRVIGPLFRRGAS